MSKETRCAVCGKVIEQSEEVMQVSKGSLKGKNKKIWGTLHTSCFDRLSGRVDSPEAVLEQVQRLGGGGSKPTKKKVA
jgi:hypothetical protein